MGEIKICFPFLLARVCHRAEQKEKQGRDRGHRWPRDTAVSLPIQRASGVGRADEEAENVALLLAARWGEHGKGTGSLQALPIDGLWGQEERRGGRHLRGAQGVFKVSLSVAVTWQMAAKLSVFIKKVTVWTQIICADVFQWVWDIGGGPAGTVIPAGWDHGHEAADLWAEELEQLHLFKVGRLLPPAALRGSHMHPNAAVRHVDGTAEHAQELLVQGSCSI